MLVVWEADDLRVSLDEPGQHNNALVCVLALPDGRYGLHWRPFTLYVDETSATTDVMPRVVVDWGAPQSRRDVQLPAVIQDVLDQWHTAAPDPHEPFPRMERAGYAVDWFVRH